MAATETPPSTASKSKAAKALLLASVVVALALMLSAFVSAGRAAGSRLIIYEDHGKRHVADESYGNLHGRLRARFPFSYLGVAVESDAPRNDDDEEDVSDYYYLILHYREDGAGRAASTGLARLIARDAGSGFRPAVYVSASSSKGCPTMLLHPGELNVIEAPDLAACDARSLAEGLMTGPTSSHEEDEEEKERQRGIKIVHVAPLDSSGLIASNMARLGQLQQGLHKSSDESLDESQGQQFGDDAIQVLMLATEDLNEHPGETAQRLFDFLLPGASNEASRERMAEAYAMARPETSV